MRASLGVRECAEWYSSSRDSGTWPSSASLHSMGSQLDARGPGDSEDPPGGLSTAENSLTWLSVSLGVFF